MDLDQDVIALTLLSSNSAGDGGRSCPSSLVGNLVKGRFTGVLQDPAVQQLLLGPGTDVKSAAEFYDVLSSRVHTCVHEALGKGDAGTLGAVLAAGASCLNIFAQHNLTGQVMLALQQKICRVNTMPCTCLILCTRALLTSGLMSRRMLLPFSSLPPTLCTCLPRHPPPPLPPPQHHQQQQQQQHLPLSLFLTHLPHLAIAARLSYPHQQIPQHPDQLLTGERRSLLTHMSALLPSAWPWMEKTSLHARSPTCSTSSSVKHCS